jgi:putative oxidoreductase
MGTRSPSKAGPSRWDSSRRQRRRRAHRGHSLGVATLRGLVGALFVGHGAQKLFGAFDGPGLEATAAGFERLGLVPGRQMAAVAGAAELAGGSLLALGAASPLPAAVLTGVMATAIDRVHLRNGPWVTNGGYEYNGVLIAALFALTDAGPGKLSIDHLRGRHRRGLGWAVTELGLGLGGSLALKALLERQGGAGPEVAVDAVPDGAGVESDQPERV